MKKHLKWTKDLEIGVDEIDKQHKKMYKLANRLLSDCLKPGESDWIKVKVHLEEIFCFAQEHFKTEKRLMTQFGYPDMEEHCKKHEVILKKLKDIKSRSEKEEDPSGTFNHFACEVVKWFSANTMSEDKVLGRYLRDKIKQPKTIKAKLKKFIP